MHRHEWWRHAVNVQWAVLFRYSYEPPMLDLNFVRNNLPLVEQKLRDRGLDPAEILKDFHEVDQQRRQAITDAETIKARRNRASEEIAKLKKSGQDASTLVAETKELREQIQDREKVAADLEKRSQQILTGLPNLPNESVPVGKSAEDNVEIRRWGTPPKFDFTPKPHWELGEQLGVLDLERAAKLSGARFAVYWDLGARLERALANFMLDVHTREHGYTEVLPPYLVNSESMYGTGQLPKFVSDLFRVPHGEKELWLIPTAEVPVTNLYRDEVLEAASHLPRSLTAYTPCFRSEAGSYGKDVRGIIRQILISNWRSSRRMLKPSFKSLVYTTGRSRFARLTWDFLLPRLMTSRYGCRASNYSARFLRVRILRRFRRAALIFAIVRRGRTRPSSCIL